MAEKEEEEKKYTGESEVLLMAFSDQLVVGLATCGGSGSEQASGAIIRRLGW